jgi:hypothetical protein
MHKHNKEAGMVMEDNPRRSFFKKLAAAAGVFAAAGYTKGVISKAVESKGDICAKYAADVTWQEKAVKANQLVLMTDEEKQQRIEDLLNSYRQEIA